MLSLSSANNSVMCNKTSSGSVSSESMIEVGCTQGGCNNVARRISRAEPVSNQVNSLQSRNPGGIAFSRDTWKLLTTALASVTKKPCFQVMSQIVTLSSS